MAFPGRGVPVSFQADSAGRVADSVVHGPLARCRSIRPASHPCTSALRAGGVSRAASLRDGAAHRRAAPARAPGPQGHQPGRAAAQHQESHPAHWRSQVEPLVWRRVLVSNQWTLASLHGYLQWVMGWTDSHAHEFEIDEGMVTEAMITEAPKKDDKSAGGPPMPDMGDM